MKNDTHLNPLKINSLNLKSMKNDTSFDKNCYFSIKSIVQESIKKDTTGIGEGKGKGIHLTKVC